MSAVSAPTQAPVWSHTRRGWNDVVTVASVLAVTIDAYLAELAHTLAPASVQAAETTLRQFTGRVIAIDPHCRAVASITEHHVRDYTEWFARRVDPTTGRTVSSNTVNYRLAQLRLFFERIDRWGYLDAPASIPVPPRRGRQPRPPRPPARPRVNKITDAVATPTPTRSRARRRNRPVGDGPVTSSFRRGPDSTWDEIIEQAPQMAATMTAYLEQLAVSSRPSTVVSTAQVLRQFAAHVTPPATPATPSTGGSSATATAPAPSSSTADSKPSAKAAASTKPGPRSSTSSAANATTPTATTTPHAPSSTTNSSTSSTTTEQTPPAEGITARHRPVNLLP